MRVTVRRKERQEELGEGKQGKDTRKREKKRERERERERRKQKKAEVRESVRKRMCEAEQR